MPTLLRTPESCFENLPDYPFAPHYFQYDKLGSPRVHYLDEAPAAMRWEVNRRDAILCLHGEPSWSFLYRKMIPILAQRHRVIVPDLVGFGRSDKYADEADCTFEALYAPIQGLIDHLNLHGITLVCQDWGGLVGLYLASQQPERFARLVIMNTGLPDGSEPMTDGFMTWRGFVERTGRDLPIGALFYRSVLKSERMPKEVREAYEAPFPDASYKAAVAAYPLLIPLQEDDPVALYMAQARRKLAFWRKPALIMFSDGDPITAGGDEFFLNLIPGSIAEPVRDAGHFLQEEKGEELAERILRFIERTGSV